MLIQVDGSHHPWLEERGPRFVLLLAVDDATGVVANAVFRQAEDTRGYLTLMDELIRRWGIPLARYIDRHGVFKFNGRPRHIPRPIESTHFTRAMRGLGVQQISALSPQAKGRVERAAGTFQDRLVTELRLAKASTIQQANEILMRFIPRFNARFRVKPEQPDAGLPSCGSGSEPCRGSLLQALPQGGQGQHRQVQLAHPATAARRGAAQLCRCEGRSPGASRRQPTAVP